MRSPVKKKALFYVILIGLVWISTECIGFGIYQLFRGDFRTLRKERKEIISGAESQYDADYSSRAKKKNWNVIHPYLGFVTEGSDQSKECPKDENCDRRLRTYEDSPFIKSTENNLIVAVIGGSFAAGVSYGSSPGLLEHLLKKVERFKNKEIIIYHLAPGGYKQPQQLLKINYFLSLGAEFDVIINIDGFNEIALPGVENLPKGVHPAFPRNWYYYVEDALNHQLFALYGKRENFRLKRIDWAGFFSLPILDFLPSMNFVWKFRDILLVNQLAATDIELVQYRENSDRKMPYEATGPDYHFTTWDAFYQDMAEVWSRSSYQIYNLCRGLGVEYFHFLQPNQYVEGSKPMLEDEAKIAFSKDSLYGQAARDGYPFLMRRGKWLLDQHVPFYDLTMIFSGDTRQLYKDDCCHLNKHGYDLVVKEIATIIRDHNTD